MSSSKVSLHKNPKTSNEKQERPFSDFTQLDLLNWEFNIRGTKKKLRDIIRVMLSKDEVELLEPQSQNEKKFQKIVLSAINKQRKRKKRPLIKTVELRKSDVQINETQDAINVKKIEVDNCSVKIKNPSKQQKPVKEVAEIINETFKLKVENSIKLFPNNKSQIKVIPQEIQSVDNTIKLSLSKKSSMKNLNEQSVRTDQNSKKHRKRSHTKTSSKDYEADVRSPDVDADVENSIKLFPNNKSQIKVIPQEIQSVDNTIKLSLSKKSSMKNLNEQIVCTEQHSKKHRKRSHTKTLSKDYEADVRSPDVDADIENSIKLFPNNKSQIKVIPQEIQSVDNTIKLSLSKKSSMKNLNEQIVCTEQNLKKHRKRSHTKTSSKDYEADVRSPKLKKSCKNAYTAAAAPNEEVLYLRDEAELQTETATKTVNDTVSETVAKNTVESKDKNVRYEISLFDIKSKEKYISDWNDNEHQLLLKNQYSSIYYIFKHNSPTDVVIKVNNTRFKCHLAILQTYSTFFLKYKNQKVIELNSKEIDSEAFKIIYDFMINKQPRLGRNYLLEVFRAASYLRVKSIVEYCWRFFDHPFFCLEDSAFVIYLDSQIANFKFHKIFRDQMFKKISKFFLCLIATKEFLNFNINELRQLLSSDEVAVNTEMEIFYSAVRWINYDYKSRYRHTLMIMNCVRFNLVPSEILLDLGKTNELEVQYIISQKKVAKLIQEGITYSTALEYYSNDYEALQRALRKYNLKKPINRQWVFDIECMHHHKIDCVNLHKVNYKRFLNYLYNMRNLGIEHWKTYKKVDEISTILECCSYKNNESYA